MMIKEPSHRRAPPEDCGGARAFMARRDALPRQVEDLHERIVDAVTIV